MTKFNRNLLQTTAASALLIAMEGGVARAQSTDTDQVVSSDQDDVIVVTGIRASIGQSVDDKRNSGQIIDTINAEDIGKSTDQNIAEALNRVSGVSISTVDGEGVRRQII